ncbi:hypothetical protein ebA1340 [Aromatoleum aromaticum EbN1]|uniref:Uncharacterized protein n=1 Tax=Aromatoleum aromaticum (strain DSM 19018 / LMG 30748 / EbN1) TaxID=76114 RepID=Q5P759_AROAE|nr:hypothetical protein ebA1340 [Aromatoleum aromaticum EbN1]
MTRPPTIWKPPAPFTVIGVQFHAVTRDGLRRTPVACAPCGARGRRRGWHDEKTLRLPGGGLGGNVTPV